MGFARIFVLVLVLDWALTWLKMLPVPIGLQEVRERRKKRLSRTTTKDENDLVAALGTLCTDLDERELVRTNSRGACYPQSSPASVLPFGDPIPVTLLYPAFALYPPLLPFVTS